jgi:hypothetical protein
MSSHVEGYRADLAQARRELAAAQIAQSEAEAATEVRKARGLLARLMAAWQGGVSGPGAGSQRRHPRRG